MLLSVMIFDISCEAFPLYVFQIPYPESNNPMFGLGIGEKAKRCQSLLQWITYRIQYHRKRIEAAVRERKY